MPDFVMLNDSGEPQGIDYAGMVPAMIHKIQELNDRLKALEAV